MAFFEQKALLCFRLLEKFFKSQTQLTQFLWPIEPSKLISWAAGAELRIKNFQRRSSTIFVLILIFDWNPEIQKNSLFYFSHWKRHQDPVPSRNFVKNHLKSTYFGIRFYVNLHWQHPGQGSEIIDFVDYVHFERKKYRLVYFE